MALAEFPIDLSNRSIAIGYPSPEWIDYRFHSSLIELITQMSKFVQLHLTNSVGSTIAKNRNTIVQNARQMGATDILWIDTDSVFPAASLARLLLHQKDIVCATTCRRVGNERLPIAVPVDIKSIQPYQKLVRMKQIGFPLMLTSMKVFDKLDELGLCEDGSYFADCPRWMLRKIGWEISGHDTLVAEDEYWCQLVRMAGFEIWCDMELTMEIGHIGTTVNYVQNQEQPSVVDEVL